MSASKATAKATADASKATLGLGLFIFLLCIPVIGWFILLLLAIGENKQRPSTKPGKTRRVYTYNPWSPWFLNAVKGI